MRGTSVPPRWRGDAAALGLALILVALAFTVRGDEPKTVTCTPKDTPVTCTPPASLPVGFFADEVMPPYDVAVRFGGTRPGGNGETLWIWLATSAPSRRCTAAELKIGRAHAAACNRRIGEEVMQSPRFKAPPVKR